MSDVQQRLEYLRQELRMERISMSELAELQSLKDQIDPGDVELLEAAGVPEFPEETVAVGDRLIVNNEDAWTCGSQRGTQRSRVLVEVTAVSEHNASWKVIELLSVSGEPPHDARIPAPGSPGGFALRFLDDLITGGIYERA